MCVFVYICYCVRFMVYMYIVQEKNVMLVIENRMKENEVKRIFFLHLKVNCCVIF